MSTLNPQLSDTFGGPVYLLLVAAQSIPASEGPEARIALGTYRGVHGGLGPYFVLAPNVTVLLLLITSIFPPTSLFGTASVRGGVFPETEVEQFGSLVGRKSNSPHLVGVKFLMVTSLPRTEYASFGFSSCGGGFDGERRTRICRSARLTTVTRRIIHSLYGVSCA